MGELFNLFADVLEEGIASPPSNEHNSEDGNIVKVHCHCSSTPNGMGPYVFSFEAKDVFPDDGYCCA